MDHTYGPHVRWSSEIPASGAWQPGDPIGDRQFHHLNNGNPFALEAGDVLNEAVIAYETWGELNQKRDNAILVCHALTGDSHASGRRCRQYPAGGWWAGVIGSGLAIDTDRYFVVCANVLGGCQGSTGPSSIDPLTKERYGGSFPTITIRDIVRSQASLTNELGIDSWFCVIGGSMGGMQSLEWALMFPDRVERVATLASCARASASQIAWSSAGRLAIANDPNYNGGNYYEAPAGQGPHIGLAIARSIAQITYRSEHVYSQRFAREQVDARQPFGRWDRFQVESYLDYHGEKLARRFDANSYLILNRALDLHDIARGRGSIARAFKRLRCPLLSVSITSDFLYPPYQQSEIARYAAQVNVPVHYEVIESNDGHDGFLLEEESVGETLENLLAEPAL